MKDEKLGEKLEDECHKIGDGYGPNNTSPFIDSFESTLRWRYPERYLKNLLTRPEVTVHDTYSGGSYVNPASFNDSLWLKITPDDLFFLSGSEGRRYNMSTTEKLELFRYSES